MTYLIENFLKRHEVSAIYGKPQAFQLMLSEEIAFSVASGYSLFGDPSLRISEDEHQVVIFVDGHASKETMYKKMGTWCQARGITKDLTANLTPINVRYLSNQGNLAASFFADLDKLNINPTLIVSATAALEMSGFQSFEAFRDLSIVHSTVARYHCAALLAGHTGAFGEVIDLETKTDSQWKATLEGSRKVILTQGDIKLILNGDMAGGKGHLPIVLFNTEKQTEGTEVSILGIETPGNQLDQLRDIL